MTSIELCTIKRKQCPMASDCDTLHIYVWLQNVVINQILCSPISKLFELLQNIKAIRALWNMYLTSCHEMGVTAAAVAVGLQMSRLYRCRNQANCRKKGIQFCDHRLPCPLKALAMALLPMFG